MMTDLNSYQSINLSQFFDSVKFRSGYHLVIEVFIVFNYKVPLQSFAKNIYCNFECEHDIGKKWWVFKK